MADDITYIHDLPSACRHVLVRSGSAKGSARFFEVEPNDGTNAVSCLKRIIRERSIMIKYTSTAKHAYDVMAPFDDVLRPGSTQVKTGWTRLQLFS